MATAISAPAPSISNRSLRLAALRKRAKRPGGLTVSLGAAPSRGAPSPSPPPGGRGPEGDVVRAALRERFELLYRDARRMAYFVDRCPVMTTSEPEDSLTLQISAGAHRPDPARGGFRRD